MVASNERSMRDPRRAWVILAMVVVFMMINFADKAVIGLAAVPIIRDLHLTNAQFGEIGSAFFLLFSLSAALVGFVVNRVSTKAVLAVMGLIWALTQLPMLGLISLPALMASRIVLGAGEGPAFPVAPHAVYKWFPNGRRAFPTSFVSIGAPLGIALFSPLLTGSFSPIAGTPRSAFSASSDLSGSRSGWRSAKKGRSMLASSKRGPPVWNMCPMRRC